MRNRTSVRRRQGGFNLIEIAVVLVIIGIIAGGIYAYYSSTRAGANAQNAAKGALGIQAAINRVRPGPTYTGLTAAQIVKLVPSNFVSSGALQDPWGKTIDIIQPAGTPNEYGIGFRAVPSAECLEFVAQVAGNFDRVIMTAPVTAAPSAIPTTTVVKTSGGDYDANAAATQCNSTPTRGVVLVGF
jgi:prepilin-type N-terminal cleavage/methylation domain-containing protein